MFNKITDSIDELNENVQSYTQSTAEYVKLDIFKRSMKSFISVVKIVLLGVIAFLALTFVSIAVAVLIGENMENTSYGFFIVGGFYILVFVLIAIFGKKLIEGKVLSSFSRTFFND